MKFSVRGNGAGAPCGRLFWFSCLVRSESATGPIVAPLREILFAKVELRENRLVAIVRRALQIVEQAAAAGKSLARFVDAPVADYIKKMGLYTTSSGDGR